MKCDICGEELGNNKVVCHICSNIITDALKNKKETGSEKKAAATPRRDESALIDAAARSRTGDESVVVQFTRPPQNRFCTQCGSMLGMNTMRCPVCDERNRELIRIRESNLRGANVRAKRAETIKNKQQIKINVTIAVIMTLIAMFVITAIIFFRLIGEDAQSTDEIVTAQPQITEEAVQTDVPITDDGIGKVHWKPINE